MSDWHRKVYKKAKNMTYIQREEWRAIRKACLIRDNYTCYRCKKHSKSGKGLSVHHLVPRDRGGEDDMNNLVTLCNVCHDYVECEGYTTLDAIAASINDEIIKAPEKEEIVREESFIRPDWHARVYGGQRG